MRELPTVVKPSNHLKERKKLIMREKVLFGIYITNCNCI